MNSNSAIWGIVQHIAEGAVVALQHVRIDVTVQVVPAGQASATAIPTSIAGGAK